MAKLASDLFGGKEPLARRIVSLLNGKSFTDPPLDVNDPVGALAQIPKSTFTRFLFLNDLKSSDVFPAVDWGDDRSYWEEQSVNTQAVGSNGASAPQALALRLHIQQTALEEIFAPSPTPTKEEAEKIEEFRDRFKSALGS